MLKIEPFVLTRGLNWQTVSIQPLELLPRRVAHIALTRLTEKNDDSNNEFAA